jgi:hypothetical protein
MQNWEHVKEIFAVLNELPKQVCDVISPCSGLCSASA